MPVGVVAVWERPGLRERFGHEKALDALDVEGFSGSLLGDWYGYFSAEITSPDDAMFPFAPTAHRVVTVPTW